MLRASVDLSAAGLTAELIVGRWAGPSLFARIILHTDPELPSRSHFYGSVPNTSNLLRTVQQLMDMGFNP